MKTHYDANPFPKILQLFLFAWVLAAVLVTASTGRVGAATGTLQNDFASVDAYVKAEMDELKIPGMELAIVHGDQLVYSQGYGVADPSGRPVTAQTPMILGSVSKGITALAVMQLVDAGKIQLDAPVIDYLPWFRLSNASGSLPPDEWKKITVRQLLNHTSGISEYTGANSWDERYAGEDALEKSVRSFADFPLARTPGSQFGYSNANYELLGLIVESATGQAYTAYVDKNIFRPLEMSHSYALAAQAGDLATGYSYWFGMTFAAPGIAAPRAHAPSAFLISSAVDMGHYLSAQMNAGRYGAAQLLSPQSVSEMHRANADTGNGYGYAMGWSVAPDGALSHNGEAPTFTSGIRIEGDWGVFVVRNIAANQREQRLDEIAPGILNVVRGQAPQKNTLDPSFRRTMIELAVLLVLQLAGLSWALRGLIKKQAATRRPAKQPLAIAAIILVLLFDLALAAGLWVMGPVSNHRSFNILAQAAPDQFLLLGTNLGLALLGAALQLVKLARW
jgi:CubicO group peptidase (beta-lactamase class C family)